VKASDNRIAHVRPHGRDSRDVDIFNGKQFVKKSFWLNDTYMMDVISSHLKKG